VNQEILRFAGLLSPSFIELVNQKLYLGIGIVAAVVVILVGIAAYQSLYFSRRIAGPIYALANHFEKCGESGKIEPLRLRKNDLFSDVAEKFNTMAEKVSK